MVKLLVFAVRKSTMSFEEFDAYWREKHAPLIRSTHEFSRHVKKYVQSHVADSAVPLAGSSQYDGVAELWFDSVDELKAAFSEPRYLEVIRPDELKFVDLNKSVSMICEEYQVI